MKTQRQFLPFAVVCLMMVLSACADKDDSLRTLDAGEVRTLGENCAALYNQHIDAWNSRVPENLRQIYTDDIVHFDGEPLYVGIDEVVDMADLMFQVFPAWEMAAGETFISKDKCLGTWINWGVFGFTPDDPGREYDLLETRGDKIFFWTLYYDQKFHTEFATPSGFDTFEPGFLEEFAATWSSSKSSDIRKLYTKDAKLVDSLFEISVSDQQGISRYARSFFIKSPDASWETLDNFAESRASFTYLQEHPVPALGGVFGITITKPDGQSCEIRAVVILQPDTEGMIQFQETFYDADTLITCGWAE